MSTNSISDTGRHCQAVTAIHSPPRPELIKAGYRFGRRVVTRVDVERERRIVHGFPCGCHGAFGLATCDPDTCVLIEWNTYRYTVRCDCGCTMIMDWFAVTSGGRFTCNRIKCECTPSRFSDLYRDTAINDRRIAA